MDSMNIFEIIPMEHTLIVNKPAKGPGPVTLMNIKPYTKAGIVLIAITIVLNTRAIGLGTTFVAPKKANGIASTAPTSVPKKAIHSVSNNK